MERNLYEIASHFKLNRKPAGIDPLGEGFINDTFVIRDDRGPAYILQRKNHIVFPDVEAMMSNIDKVTRHIREKAAACGVCGEDLDRVTLTVVETNEGDLCHADADGNFWAVCRYIGGSVCYSKADSVDLVRQGGLGLGSFHNAVCDFNEPLTEIIKGFHNIRWRFRQWDEALERNAAGRVAELGEEISWIESRRGTMLDFWHRYEQGEIPARVIHGDTKISNFLFDSVSGNCLCAIDLDTMMTSTLLCDVGDALRAYTNTAAEDEPDTSRVGMDMDYFRAYMRGYIEKMRPSLSSSEMKYLAFSGIYIAFEQVLRFLMDYVDGDIYYRTAYAGHNLVRTRAQYALLCSMERQLDEMNAFVEKELLLQ